MKAALFFKGNERFPSNLPLLQRIREEPILVDNFSSIEIVRLTASQQRGKVSDSVRQTYDDFFSAQLNGKCELIARIIGFLSGVEAVFKAIEIFDDQQNKLILLDGFKPLVREASLYESSGLTDLDKIGLKYHTRQATAAIIGRRKLDMLVLVSMGGIYRRVITDIVCDNHLPNSSAPPWARAIVPIDAGCLAEASRVSANSLHSEAWNHSLA